MIASGEEHCRGQESSGHTPTVYLDFIPMCSKCDRVNIRHSINSNMSNPNRYSDQTARPCVGGSYPYVPYAKYIASLVKSVPHESTVKQLDGKEDMCAGNSKEASETRQSELDAQVLGCRLRSMTFPSVVTLNLAASAPMHQFVGIHNANASSSLYNHHPPVEPSVPPLPPRTHPPRPPKAPPPRCPAPKYLPPNCHVPGPMP